MQLVLKPNETVSVNQIIKRGSFPVNLRIKRIHNHDNLQAQFLPTEENDYRPYAGRCKNGKGKRLVMQKSMETDDVFEAAKRAVAWVEEIAKRGRDAKELKKGAAQSLVHYWNLYFDKEMKTIIDATEGFFVDSGGCRKFFAYGWD